MSIRLSTQVNPSLAALSRGRDNNLNLLRIVAAIMVLVSHSYVMVSGSPADEPWDATLGRSPGGMAVEFFFVISGFLVTASLAGQGSVWRFAAARVARIYPGLWVSLLATIALVGFGYTTLSWQQFFADTQTWKFFLKNALMITGGEGALPGVFVGNPFAHAVNGSLWTLRYELRLYALLAMLWLILRFIAPRRFPWRAIVSVLALGLSVAAVAMLWTPWRSDFIRLGGMFFTGSAMFAWRERIAMGGGWVLAGLAGMTFCAATSPGAFELAYRLAMPYALLWLAYCPGSGGGLAAAIQQCR